MELVSAARMAKVSEMSTKQSATAIHLRIAGFTHLLARLLVQGSPHFSVNSILTRRIILMIYFSGDNKPSFQKKVPSRGSNISGCVYYSGDSGDERSSRNNSGSRDRYRGPANTNQQKNFTKLREDVDYSKYSKRTPIGMYNKRFMFLTFLY